MRSMRYGLTIWMAGAALLTSHVSAQDDYLNYMGARPEVPDEAPTVNPLTGDSPQFITPGEPRRRANQETSGESDADSEASEESEGEDYFSEYIGSVELSHSRERFNWFYSASELYMGVIPNIRDTLPHIARFQAVNERRPRNRITWIGFQPFDSFTRVFVQMADSPNYTIEESEGGQLVEVFFENTTISLSNFQRFMDTSFFGRSVDVIDAQPLSGHRARLIIWRDSVTPYTVTVDGDYLYIDFNDVGR